MATKRSQQRNERNLQELIKNVPGNNTCADCGARNPGWASWSLGIFLCMRCAGCHRKLGTHISKVKSLSMDSWTNDQVENMKRTGNIASNRVYNPQNAKPPIPFDADEADSAMERFIRQKYQEQGLGAGARAQAPARHYSGSTESDDLPPPLPPKEKSRFGFRSASSIFPMSSKAKREAAATAHLEAQRQNQRSPSPPLRSKPSRVFGSTAAGSDDDLDRKLAKLRDMGFSDDRRNATVLKGLGGNVEKAVEALVRLGEGSSTSRSRTPLTPTTGITTGLTVERKREVASPASSNNPWDIPAAPLQSSQSTGNVQARAQQQQQANGNPYHTSGSNPFGLAPSQSQYNLNQQYQLDQAFQNLSMGQPQALFPNHTGGFADRQPYQQAAAPPPMPSIPQNYAPAIYDAPIQQQQQVQQSYNPFLQQQQQVPQQQTFNTTLNTSFSSNPYTTQQSPTSNPYASQQLSPISSNPFGVMQQSPTSYTPQPQQPQQSYFDQPNQQQQQQQSQASFYSPNQQQQTQPPQPRQQPAFQQHNPFNMPQPQQPVQVPQQQYGQYQNQQFQQLQPQQTGRADKTSILALYNYPQLAPIPQAQLPPDMDPNQNQGQNVQQQQQSQNQGYPTSPLATQLPQRSFSTPLSGGMGVGSHNPFMVSPGGSGAQMQVPGGVNGSMGMGQQQSVGQARQVSRESVMVDSGGWHGQNGRHSPDAFANLSSRSLR